MNTYEEYADEVAGGLYDWNWDNDPLTLLRRQMEERARAVQDQIAQQAAMEEAQVAAAPPLAPPPAPVAGPYINEASPELAEPVYGPPVDLASPELAQPTGGGGVFGALGDVAGDVGGFFGDVGDIALDALAMPVGGGEGGPPAQGLPYQDLPGAAWDVYNTDIPYYSDFARETLVPLAGDVGAYAGSFMTPPGLGQEELGADVGRFVAETAVPVTAGDVVLEASPLGTVGDVRRALRGVGMGALAAPGRLFPAGGGDELVEGAGVAADEVVEGPYRMVFGRKVPLPPNANDIPEPTLREIARLTNMGITGLRQSPDPLALIDENIRLAGYSQGKARAMRLNALNQARALIAPSTPVEGAGLTADDIADALRNARGAEASALGPQVTARDLAFRELNRLSPADFAKAADDAGVPRPASNRAADRNAAANQILDARGLTATPSTQPFTPQPLTPEVANSTALRESYDEGEFLSPTLRGTPEPVTPETPPLLDRPMTQEELRAALRGMVEGAPTVPAAQQAPGGVSAGPAQPPSGDLAGGAGAAPAAPSPGGAAGPKVNRAEVAQDLRESGQTALSYGDSAHDDIVSVTLRPSGSGQVVARLSTGQEITGTLDEVSNWIDVNVGSDAAREQLLRGGRTGTPGGAAGQVPQVPAGVPAAPPPVTRGPGRGAGGAVPPPGAGGPPTQGPGRGGGAGVPPPPSANQLASLPPQQAAVLEHFTRMTEGVVNNDSGMQEVYGSLRNITAKISGDYQDSKLAELVAQEVGLRSALAKADRSLSGEDLTKIVNGWQKQMLQRFYPDAAARKTAQDILTERSMALQNTQLAPLESAQETLRSAVLSVDAAVAGQNLLAAGRRGAVPIITGAVNDIATKFHLPGMPQIYLRNDLDKTIQGMADGLIPFERAAADIDTSKSLFGKVPGVGKFAQAGLDRLADLQYGAIMGSLRLRAYEGLLLQNKILNTISFGRLGGDISDPLVRRHIAEMANMVGSTARSASAPNRAAWERFGLLSPRMTRAQINEMLTPLRTFRSQEDAINTLNLAGSFVAALGAGKALNDMFGIDEFVMNPLEAGFGQITVPLKDASGRNRKIDIMPQDTISRNVIAAVLAATEEGGPDWKQLGEIVTRTGFQRANILPQDVARFGGVGYGEDNGQLRMHYGDLPLGEAAGQALPVPISLQGAIRDAIAGRPFDPAGLALDTTGFTNFPESWKAVQDRTANEWFGQDFAALPAAQQARLNREIIKSGVKVPFSRLDDPWWKARDDALARWQADMPPALLEDPITKQALKIKDPDTLDTELADWIRDTYDISRQAAADAVKKFKSQTKYDNYVRAYRKEVLAADPEYLYSWADAYEKGQTRYPPSDWVYEFVNQLQKGR